MLKQFFFLLDEKKEGDGGGDTAKEIASLKESNAALLARLDLIEAAGKKKTAEDDDLNDKAKKQREADDKKSSDIKSLEAAVKFNLGSKDWLTTNASLLPKNIEDIFMAAEKEKFDSAVDKRSSIQSGIIDRFFEIQANLEFLTPGLKSALEDWQKLTKNGKQEQASRVYDTVFEPAFEMLKRVKKAEQLNKGFGNASDAETAYRNRLISLSRKHYLGEKPNA